MEGGMGGKWESLVYPGHCMDFSQSLLVLHSVRHDLLVVQHALTGRGIKTQGQVHGSTWVIFPLDKQAQ